MFWPSVDSGGLDVQLSRTSEDPTPLLALWRRLLLRRLPPLLLLLLLLLLRWHAPVCGVM